MEDQENILILDEGRIDDAVLALLYLGIHDGTKAWKSHDEDALMRLHERGFITNPKGGAKSMAFTEKGLEEAERLLYALFSAREDTER